MKPTFGPTTPTLPPYSLDHACLLEVPRSK